MCEWVDGGESQGRETVGGREEGRLVGDLVPLRLAAGIAGVPKQQLPHHPAAPNGLPHFYFPHPLYLHLRSSTNPRTHFFPG